MPFHKVPIPHMVSTRYKWLYINVYNKTDKQQNNRKFHKVKKDCESSILKPLIQ